MIRQKSNVTGTFSKFCDPNVISERVAAAAYNTKTGVGKIPLKKQNHPKQFQC